ncbi:MAG: hypothetical protein ABJH63_20645 [Rhizobiaceae bacterium]
MLSPSASAGSFDETEQRDRYLPNAPKVSWLKQRAAKRAPHVRSEVDLSCVRIFKTGVVVGARGKGAARVQDCPAGYGLMRSFEHGNRAKLKNAVGMVRYYNVVRDWKIMGRASLRVAPYPRDLVTLRAAIKEQKDMARPLRLKSAEQRRSAARDRFGALQRGCCANRSNILGRSKNINWKFAG